jgi:hypothetical protein
MSDLTFTAKNIVPLEGAVTRPFVAGGALNVGDSVYMASDGDVEQSDGNVSNAVARSIGVVTASYDGETTIAAGHACTVCVYGPVGGFTSLTPGNYGYVSNTAGKIADAAGTFNFIVGRAEDTDVFFVDPGLTAPTSP